MKKIIRKSCFETNSSSTHSLSVDESFSESLLETVPLDNGVFKHSCYGDYGWEIETYNDVIDKIDYMSIYVRDWCGGRSDEFKDVLTRVIMEQSQASGVEINFGSDDDGYIDHQSVECNDYHYLFESPELLRMFIFSPKSSFRTDNDNH